MKIMVRDGDPAPLETLVNQIAHDVRNHAFTIGLQAEMGVRRTANTPEARAHFEAILRQVDTLNRYIEQLLLYGRPAGLTPAPMDLVSLVHDQIQRLQCQGAAEGSPLDVQVEAAGRSCRGCWDARALGHAVAAVLDNAVHSARPSPPVRVTVRSDSHCAVVEIRDAGPGIPPETLAKLAVPMAARRPGAAGLGLAIARKMVEAHGGRLDLESGPAGTTVRLTLPCQEVSAAVSPGA